jgi:hypothetical protein
VTRFLLAVVLVAPATAAAAGATVAVEANKVVGTLSPDAVGLSYEMRTVGEGGFDASTGNEAAVFATLGVRNIRIGGNTVDYGTFWQPGGRPVPPWASIIITPADVQRVAAFARRIDAKVEWAVNIQHLDATLIDDEVGAVTAAFGDRLDSIQCGNEPNTIFGGYAAFKAAFDTCKGAIKGRAKISGPDTVGGGGSWNASFVADEAAALGQVSFHYYVGAHTVAALLAPGAIDGAAQGTAGSLSAARAHGLPYRTDETNSDAGGGAHGVSDVYASALWAMHYALATAARGAGLNFHGFLGVCGQPTVNGKNDYYTPICAASAADEHAKVMTAGPEFYGLWMATHLGPGQFLSATASGANNLVAYAVKGDDGALRVALIEKSATGSKLMVQVMLGATGTAEVLRLTAPSLTAPDGITVQGASLGRDGRLTPGAPDRVPIANGALTIDLATGSAALISVPMASGPPPMDAGVVSGDAEAPMTVDAGRAPLDVATSAADARVAAAEDAGAPTEDDASPPPRVASRSGGCDIGGSRASAGPVALLVPLAFVRRRRRSHRPALALARNHRP